MNGNVNFLLDTNIIISFLKGHEVITRYFQTMLSGKVLEVSQITRMELLGYPDITSEEEATIYQFLELVDIGSITKLDKL